MKIFNTLGRHLDEFKPENKSLVKLYTCGPTVYDDLHIGNLRTFVFYDTLRRALDSAGYTVKHVMNITDVGHLTSDADEGEDKLDKGARREGKTARQVAEHYTEKFFKDVKKLNILAPEYARATDFIDAQLAVVAKLLDKGLAYKTEQAIYFDTSKLADYGQLTGQRLTDKEVAVRAEVHADKNKKHPQDFAVWFFAVGRYKDHELRWPSEWGEGFPGWHLECSAIAHELLGEPLDIHAGGVDLIGTHHTNEIAQTEAAFGTKLANYWVHGEHLMVDGKKMAKSDDSFVTLGEIVRRGFDPLALRLLFLQSHYRSQMNFTFDSLAAASQNLISLQAWADLAHQKNGRLRANETESSQLIEELKTSLDDDLNTARALARLNEFASKVSPNEHLLRVIDSLLGLGISGRSDISDAQKQLIEARELARSKQDWQKSDEIRAQLASQGIELEDSTDGPVWHYAKPR